MRTDNRRVKNRVISIYFVLIVVTILFATVFKISDFFSNKILYVLFGLILLMLFFHFISRYFEYDSDGSTIIITNKGLLLTEYINYRENKIEFTRSQLLGFKINNYLLYKSLVVMIKGRDGVIKKSRFNVTLLKSKKLRYVRQSLKKIVRENRK